MRARLARVAVAGWLLLAAAAPASELRIGEGTNIAADASAGGERLAIDLLGSIWVLPVRGGDARALNHQLLPSRQPRWSPDNRHLLYETHSQAGNQLWLLDVEHGGSTPLTGSATGEQHGDWHPSGKRIVYSAAGPDGGLDLYERDLASGLAWRLTDHPGDEMSPAWSADGRHLVYVLHERGRWQLVLRPFGRPPRVLLDSPRPLHVPSWRPDNTLLTYLAEDERGRLGLDMLILSEPPLSRSLVRGEDFFIAPTSWVDRENFYYTADGMIRTRRFGQRGAQVVPFSAAVDVPRLRESRTVHARPPPDAAAVSGEFVVRAARLYDGQGIAYRYDVDVLVKDGRIAAVGPQDPATAATVLDIGDVTLLPGLIDAYAAAPDDLPAALRALAFGVTTLVSPGAGPAAADLPLPRMLSAGDVAAAPAERAELRLVTTAGVDRPGSRLENRVDGWRRKGVPVLADNWRTGFALGADMLLGTDSLPASPGGRRYEDLQQLMHGGPLLLVSGLADAATPGLESLWSMPQAAGMPRQDVARRFAAAHRYSNGSAAVIPGSLPSGLPPGLATQAELLALHAAGLPPWQVLHAATGAAAAALGLGGELGEISPGARADMLLVAGDPLARPSDAGQVVAIVRDGRFYSVASLLELAGRHAAVE